MMTFEWTEIRNGESHRIAADRFEWITARHGRAYLTTASRKPDGWKVCKEERVERGRYSPARFYLSESRVDEFYLVIADRIAAGWDAAERDTWEVSYFPMALTNDYEKKLEQMANVLMTAFSAKRAARAA